MNKQIQRQGIRQGTFVLLALFFWMVAFAPTTQAADGDTTTNTVVVTSDSNETDYSTNAATNCLLENLTNTVTVNSASVQSDSTDTALANNSAAHCLAEPTVTLSTDSPVVEGTNATITATLDITQSQDVTVTLVFTAGTATGGGTDYTQPATLDVVIPAGQTSVTTTVPTTDDALVEGVETFDVGVDGVVNATDGSSPQTVQILDNDSTTVGLSTNGPVVEGSDAIITATLTTPSTDAVTVTLVLTPGTAAGNGTDYTEPVTLEIVIDAGQTTGSVTVPTNDDTIDEVDETFVVDIASVVNATDGSGAPQTVTIQDNDTAEVTLSTDPSVTEGGDAIITASIDVTSSQDVTVTLVITPGTATAGGTDYTAPGTLELVIPAGSTSVTTTVATVDDALVEGVETFQVDVASVENATDGSAPQTVQILDGDSATVALSTNGPVVEGGDAVITATLTAPSTDPVTVTLVITPGTAIAGGTDYTEPGTVEIVIAPGDLTGSITVPTNDDTIDETDETFVVDVASVVNATDGSAPQTVTIQDNDTAQVTLSADPTVTEGIVRPSRPRWTLPAVKM